MSWLDWFGAAPTASDPISNFLKRFYATESEGTTAPIPPGTVAPRTFPPGTLAPWNNEATSIRSLITGRPTIPLGMDGPVNELRPNPMAPGQLDVTNRTVPPPAPPPTPGAPVGSPVGAPDPESDLMPGTHYGMRVDDPSFKQPAMAPAVSASQPSLWERIFGRSEEDPMNLDINRRINFSKNALPWQVLANIGAGMINRPKYQGFMGALGEGAKQGLKTAQDFPMKQLQQAMGEAQLGNVNLQVAQKMEMLKMAQKLPPGHPLKMPLMLAASGMDRFASAIVPKTGEGQMITPSGTAAPLPGYPEGKGEIEGRKAEAASANEIVTDYQKRAPDMQNATRLLEAMRTLIPAIKDTAGIGSQYLIDAKKAAARLGIGTEKELAGLNAAELFQKIAIQLPISSLRPDFGARPAQMEFLISAQKGYPNLEMHAGSIGPVIDEIKAQIEHKLKYAKFIEDWRSDHQGTIRGANEAFRKQYGDEPGSSSTDELVKRAIAPKTVEPPKSVMPRKGPNGRLEYPSPQGWVYRDEKGRWWPVK